jgi:hypothetical protein
MSETTHYINKPLNKPLFPLSLSLPLSLLRFRVFGFRDCTSPPKEFLFSPYSYSRQRNRAELWRLGLSRAFKEGTDCAPRRANKQTENTSMFGNNTHLGYEAVRNASTT